MSCPVHSPLEHEGLVGSTKAHNERNRLWQKKEAKRTPFYGPFARKARRMRDGITSEVVQQVRAAVLPAFAMNAAQQMIRRVGRDKVRGYLQETYRAVGVRFAKDTLQGLNVEAKAPVEDTWFAAVTQWLEGPEAGAEIRRITDTVRQDIVGILQDAFEEGAGIEEMAERVEREMAEINRRRARVIARTEVATASNKGARHGAKESIIETEKEWLDSNDPRVRDGHLIVDGQTQAMDDPYVWTSPNAGQRVQAMYPCDPSLPAASRIQCRCVELYHRVN